LAEEHHDTHMYNITTLGYCNAALAQSHYCNNQSMLTAQVTRYNTQLRVAFNNAQQAHNLTLVYINF